MKYSLLLLIVLLFSACVSNTFEKNFISSTSDYMVNPMAADHQEPELIETDDIVLDLKNFPKQDYVVLGVNNFEDKMRSRAPAIDFAKKINATHILYSRQSLGKRYVDIKAATNSRAMSDLSTYPSYNPENRKYLKENYFRYNVVYLRQRQD